MIKDALAANINLTDVGTKAGGIPGGTGLTNIISNVITILITITIVAVLFMLIYGAFQWIISGGDKEKVASARGRITHALIGLAILGLAFVIITVIGNILGITVMKDLQIPKLSD